MFARASFPRATGTSAWRRASLCAWCLATLACRPASDDQTSDADSQAEGESETGEGPAVGDECAAGPLRIDAPSTTRASLQNATPSPIAAACGIDGPVVFFDLHLDGRVDLTAGVEGREAATKLAIMRPGCLDSEEDPSRVLACADALPVTLFDVGPELELSLAVGVAEDDPALGLDPDTLDADPLEFELSLATRAVLRHGEPCGQPTARCEAGTVCLSEAEVGDETSGDETTGDEPSDALFCLRPEADSCVDPGSIALELDLVHELVIPPDEPHSDAHEHACTGWRRPERVEQLILPAELPPNAELVIRADDGRVGLALRGPSCLVEDALACDAAGGPDETFLVWGGEALAATAAAAKTPILFIELPRPDLADPPIGPITVRLEIVSG